LIRNVNQALLGGAQIIQYRNKVASVELRIEQANELRILTKKYSVPLIINDDAVLAQQMDADGVHLGGDDSRIADARALLGSHKLIGVSCYNLMELARVAVLQGADYVAFGSFFASTVKPNAVVAGLDLLQQARREIAVPLVAIGGITVESGEQLLKEGAHALAVISAVFDVVDIQGTARQFAALNYS